MKKSTRILLVAAVCLLSAGIVISVLGFITGGSYRHILENGLWNHTFYKDSHYDNDYNEANTYRVPADAIDGLSVDWVCGDVKIQSYDGDEILLEESCKDKNYIDDDTCLRYRVKYGQLSVYFCRGTAEINFSSDGSERAKKLVVKVPKDLAKNLSDLYVDAVSSDVTLRNLTCSELDIDTVSGNIFGKGLKASEASIETVSGAVTADFLTCPAEFDFSSTSGILRLGLPKKSSAILEYSTISGSIYNGFASHHGGHSGYDDDGEIIIGGGKCELSADTVSGDIEIYPGSCF